MTQSKVKWVRLGDYIEVQDIKNVDSKELPVFGINKDKAFMPTVANLDGVDTQKYKVLKKGWFVFSGMQTGRDVCIRVGIYEEDVDCLVSPAYTTFTVCEEKGILKEFFFLYFNRYESDRYGWFISDSSVRANLDWPRFLDIQIPLPSITRQREIVETWQGLRKMKEENEQIAEPLLQLCQSYIQDLKKKYPMVEIGPWIEESDERNDGSLGLESVKGVSIEKIFIETKAKMEGVNVSLYKLVKPDDFCFVPITSRNSDKITLALNKSAGTYIVSTSYGVFRVTNMEELYPDFLYMWFCRSEFDRYARFHSWGSAREAFSFDDMKRVRIPLPPIDVQHAIVNIYNCAKEAKRIANEADQLSRDICPALMQQVINE